MAAQSKNNFTEGINLDLDETRLPPNAAQYIKNITFNITGNSSDPGKSGGKFVGKPSEGNQVLSLTGSPPSGTNLCIGFYDSEQTNEGYFFLWNSSNNHSIWVIDGTAGSVRKVFQDALLNFQYDPQYFIAEGRCTMELISYYNKVTNKQDAYKMLCFTDNFNEPRCIEVEGSIATTSYTTSYFTASASNYIRETLITLGVALPIKCIGINDPTPYTPAVGDDEIQNLEIRRAWQFRVKFIDVFGRPSEHGIISNQYITIVGGGCLTASNGLPRCVNLFIDAGNPFVDFIQVEFRLWIDGLTPTEGEWLLYDTIAKYDNSGSIAYYSRSINPALTYNVTTNRINYTFCADKENIPLDPAETSRTEPDVPRMSSTIFSVAERLGLANNVHGFQPISETQLSGITISAQDPADADVPCPSAPMRTIKFYLCCFNPYGNYLAWVDRDTVGGLRVFGNSDGGDCATGVKLGVTTYTSSIKIGQVFADQANPGFIAYAAGTDYKCIMTPGDLNPVTGLFTPALPGPPHAAKMAQGVLRVPAGKYVVRIGSHKVTINDADLQKTSTYVCGQCYVSALASPASIANQYPTYVAKEMVFDCTSGDIDANQPTDAIFVVMDLGDGVHAGAQDGYLYEEPGGGPVEMVPCKPSGNTPGGTAQDGVGSYWTDHNGFYFCASQDKPILEVKIDLCDGAGLVGVRPDIFSAANATSHATMMHGDGSNTPGTHCFGENGLWSNKVYVFPNPGMFPESARRRINLHAGTCDDVTIGVPGVLSVPRVGQPGITDNGGDTRMTLHNVYDYSTVWSPLPYGGIYIPGITTIINTQEYMILSQTGSCQWTDCGGCVTSMSDPGYGFDACTGDPRPFDIEIQVKSSGTNLYGLKSGACIPVGIILHDLLGRNTFVQKRGYVYTKNLNDPTYRKFALQKLVYSIGAGVTFPTYFKWLTFVVAPDVISSDFISWQADYIQPVDNTGATNTTSPTGIRIYYQSLNEYNKQFNFGTTTNWEFIAQDAAGNPLNTAEEGDIVQFIMNGNGQWFDSVKQAVVKYTRAGNFFVIDYDSGLMDVGGNFLTNGALFRIIRPIQFKENEIRYFEQCLTIQLNSDGTVPTGKLTGTIPYFNSYLIQRRIPVPLLDGQTAAIPPGGSPVGSVKYTSTGDPATPNTVYATNNVANYNNVVSMSSIDAQTTFPFYFESPSASDFWGNHVFNCGRIFFVNKLERQNRIGTEVALSEPISGSGTFNGMSYFKNTNVETFDRNTWGDITSILAETSVMLVICDKDHFAVRFNATQLTVKDGNVTAQNPKGIFTSPERKAGTNYGLTMGFINTLARYAGFVRWLDSSGYIVLHNFSAATSNTDDAGYLGYILNKIGIINQKNLNPGANGIWYPAGKVDPHASEYLLTFFNRPASGSASYINTQSAPNLAVPETMVFDLETSRLKRFASFTGEYYGKMPSYYLQRQFLTFKNGLPYINHFNYGAGLTTPLYCNYFGTQCEVRITHVINGVDGQLLPDTVKRFLANELYVRASIPGGSGVMPSALFYADVITSEKGQVSRLLVGRWGIKDGFQCAEFICAINTPPDPNIPAQTGIHAIIDGDPLQGRWLRVSLTNNASWAGTVFEITSSVVYLNVVEKSAK